MNIQVQCTTKTLNQRYGPGRALLERMSSLMDQVARDNPMNDAQDLTHRMRVGQRTGTLEEREN